MPFRRKPDLPAPAMRALVTRLLEPGIRIERTLEGGSTQVYRLFRGAEVLYLRVAEEVGESMVPEAEVHTRLLEAGVRVPEVVAVESSAPEIDRSVMVVRAIAGAPLSAGADSATAGSVVRGVGRDLALINSMPVEGYGWIRRDVEGWPLRGECSTFRDFVESDVGTVPAFASDVFSEHERSTIEYLFDSASKDSPEARLVHGDADPTAIFHAAGIYTGLIDFGEIRGAEWYYDLAYFHLCDGDILPYPLLDGLLAGYREVVDVPDGWPFLLRRSAVVLGVSQLARWFMRDGRSGITSPRGAERIRRLKELLDGARLDR